MSESMEKIIILLRAVNVGGRKLPMAELRDLCRKAGFDDIETYIQSGNLLLSASSATAAEQRIEALIADNFGFRSEAIARTAKQWAVYANGSPFADAEERGNLVHLGLAKEKLADDVVEKLRTNAIHDEEIVVKGDALWIDFRNGVGPSKLLPEFINRCAGSPVTMRNWRTVRKLAEMVTA
jgi:uncharacterized protein (DUF1697 family)